MHGHLNVKLSSYGRRNLRRGRLIQIMLSTEKPLIVLKLPINLDRGQKGTAIDWLIAIDCLVTSGIRYQCPCVSVNCTEVW